MAALMNRGGFRLPYSVDFSTLADGALPSAFQGATWAISGGKAVNTPTLGDELFSDPGLEATYTAGKCATITLQSGTPTMTEETSDMHGGAHAQIMESTAAANAIKHNPNYTGTVGNWIRASVWHKRTGGTGPGPQMSIQGVILPAYRYLDLISASWAQVKSSGITTSTSQNIIINHAESGDTVIYDDLSFKTITSPTQYSFLTNDVSADIIIKVGFSAYDLIAGIIFRGDSRTNPQNYQVALIYKEEYAFTTTARVALIKVVNGTPSSVIAGTAITFVQDAYLEVHASGSTESLWYNGSQVSTDQTVTDGATNKIHGLASSGGSETIGRFFCGVTLTDYPIGAFGSSITAANYSYAEVARKWISSQHPEYNVQWLNQAISGHWPWSNNIRYPTNLHGQVSNIYLPDYRIVNAGRDDRALEALTRRIYADNPRAVIISPIIPEDADTNGVIDNQTQSDIDSIAMAQYYGVHLVDYRQAVIDLIAGGALLSDYLQDSIHPTVAGHALAASMIETAIVTNGWLNGETHPTLPARLYDDGEYEQAPTIKLGTGYDSKTGWTITGTRIASTTAGDLVTYSATCSQFGTLNTASGYPSNIVDVQIDGGAWVLSQIVSHNGYYGGSFAYGPHTITLRVPAGGASVRIDEFWAI
jgi:hypothetical protein